MQSTEDNKNIITGRNAIIEALKGDRPIEKIFIGRNAEGSIKKIKAMAGEKKIPLHYREKHELDRIVGAENHQSAIAVVSPYRYCSTDDILAKAEKLGEEPFILVLDGLEDPHNLGAIMRTAECCGVHGIIIPRRRATGITDTVVKVSAGAAEHVLCAKVSNITQAIEKLKEAGLWICACDMDGRCCHESDLKGKLALVIGGEGSGISRLVREKCDFTVSIPMKGKISSLNASNAAAILMYEVNRQREG